MKRMLKLVSSASLVLVSACSSHAPDPEPTPSSEILTSPSDVSSAHSPDSSIPIRSNNSGLVATETQFTMDDAQQLWNCGSYFLILALKNENNPNIPRDDKDQTMALSNAFVSSSLDVINMLGKDENAAKEYLRANNDYANVSGDQLMYVNNENLQRKMKMCVNLVASADETDQSNKNKFREIFKKHY